uniref:Uncharacterized protein n=1 Tax=Musa balbisiana TaxID=52838 RepID=B5RHS6_MUSBA|nr:uncharacterized protein [Musa balbisiana]
MASLPVARHIKEKYEKLLPLSECEEDDMFLEMLENPNGDAVANTIELNYLLSSSCNQKEEIDISDDKVL